MAERACPEGTYVICPEGTPLPDCEHGWDLSGGTTECATQAPVDLPPTGADVPAEAVVAGGVLLALGLAILIGRRWVRG